MFQGKLWKFRNMMRSSVPTKRISQIFDIGDLRSGHFCDLPIRSQWEKKSTPLYLLCCKPIWVESYRIGQLWTIRVKNFHCLPLERSFEVTRGHQPSFANNFWSKRDRDVRLVSVRWSWPGKSNDMQYDPFRTWGQTLTLTFQSHFIYVSTRLNETNTMVSNLLLYL